MILVATLVTLIVVFQSPPCDGVQRETFKQAQASHAPKSLSMSRIRSLVGVDDERPAFDSILSEILRVRVSDTPGNVAVRTAIEKRMKNLAWHVELDGFTDSTPFGVKNFYNVIATLNPSSPRRLVLACHYDSKWFADNDRQSPFVGATDSAVPCAQMIDLAQRMNNSLWQGSRANAELSLQLIFFDGEEAFVHWTATDSIYGSRHLAAKWAATPHWTSACSSATESDQSDPTSLSVLDSIDVMMLLDLIGTASPTFYNYWPNASSLFTRLSNIERKLKSSRLLEASSSSSFFGAYDRNGMGIEDDHIPFLRRGVKILHLIANPFPKQWHTRYDAYAALHFPTIIDLNRILRIWVAEYLHL